MSDPRLLRRAFLRRLKELGYGYAFRRVGWCEVLVWHGEERWTGSGPDRRAALDDVLRRMFPSAAARAALVSSFATTDTTRRPSIAPPPSEPEPEPDLVPGPAPGSEPELELRPAPRPTPVAVPAPPPSPPPRRLSSTELEELYEELNQLTDDLESAFVDTLELTPRRQRLTIMAWITRARDIRDRAAGEDSIEQGVAAIRVRLGVLTKIGWPGSVLALAMGPSPGDCLRALDSTAGRRVEDWGELADLVEEELERLDRQERSAGRDDCGWGDEVELEPPPPDPRSLMGEVRRKLQEWTGPLPRAEDLLHGETYAGEPDRDRLRALPADPNRSKLLGLARELRWLRGCDLDGWGEAMGRVRWIAQRGRHLASPELDRVLEPTFRPRAGWARECGHDPQQRLRKQRKNELLKKLPQMPRDDPASLGDWVSAALGLGQTMSNEKLAGALQQRSEDLPRLQADDLSQPVEISRRTQRNRLRKLQELVQGGPFPSTAEEPEEETVADSPLPSEPGSEPPVGEELLRFTRGKRVLIVGNRADPALDESLTGAFEFESLDRCCDLSPNRIGSCAERIRGGSYDLVLGITGFMPHKVDQVLRKACGAAGVRFVRVNKGRLAACVRHLSRELGLPSETSTPSG